MSVKFVKSAGNVFEPAVINMAASGTVFPNSVIEFIRTGGQGVNIGSASTTQTMVFGACLDYKQGKSDAEVRVIPFLPGQLWEVDCVAAALTAQVGLRHILNAGGLLIRNTSTDVTNDTGVFRAIAMTGSTSGSGKLIGEFIRNPYPVGQNQSTVI